MYFSMNITLGHFKRTFFEIFFQSKKNIYVKILLIMKYQVNTLIATLVNKEKAPKGSVGAIIGIVLDEETNKEKYLVELFTVTSIPHYQLFFYPNEIYQIQQ